MAPRKPRPSEEDDDDASSIASEVLKPKTTKAKVTKPKADKPKLDKTKAEKAKKDMTKIDKVDGEKPKKESASVKHVGGSKLDKDGKEKVKAVNGEEAIALMVAYLKRENRPYSATEVSANLHGKVTKTVADKLLKEMEQSGQVMGKATKKDGGGQWVFWPVQDASDSASPEELFIMDEQITRLRESLPALKTSFRLVTAKLNAILAAPSASELAAMVQNLQEDIKTKREKLYGFKNGSAKIVTKEESETIEREFKYWSARRKGRKDAFANLEANLLEGLTTEEIMDKAGLEHDPYQFKG